MDRRAETNTPVERRLAASGLPPLLRLAWLEIDLDALEENARRIGSILDVGNRLSIVVKADAYGHGLVPAACAALAGGADRLIVATVDEGLALRSAGVAASVLVLYPVPACSLPDVIAAGLELVASDSESIRQLGAVVRRGRIPGLRNGSRLQIHLQIDTGMTRGGVLPADAASAVGTLVALRHADLAGVWSHLASPEDDASVAAQVSRFEQAIALRELASVRPPLRHLAATGGVFGRGCPSYDMVRVGLAFYGHLPPELAIRPDAQAVAAALQPALTLKARAVCVENVGIGAEVGYGGEWRAERRSVIATLPLGYADGWTRGYWPGAFALVRGKRVPLVGRVSSDAVAADVTDAEPLRPTDEFVLLGAQGSDRITVGELAALRRSIAWEVLDSFASRLSRIYMKGGHPVGIRYLGGEISTTRGGWTERSLGSPGTASTPGASRSAARPPLV